MNKESIDKYWEKLTELERVEYIKKTSVNLYSYYKKLDKHHKRTMEIGLDHSRAVQTTLSAKRGQISDMIYLHTEELKYLISKTI